jgi:hypothetical protein
MRKCVCGRPVERDGPLCDKCGHISPNQAESGIRPWGWVAERWNSAHPEDPIDPAKAKRIHDWAMSKLRQQVARREGPAESLREFAGD